VPDHGFNTYPEAYLFRNGIHNLSLGNIASWFPHHIGHGNLPRLLIRITAPMADKTFLSPQTIVCFLTVSLKDM